MDIVLLAILIIFAIGLLGVVLVVVRILFDVLVLKNYSILFDESEINSNDTNGN